MIDQAANLLDRLPTDLEREYFETLLTRDNLKIERIISRGHSSPASGWYDQPQGEWVLVVQGAAVLEFEDDGDIRLGAGDCINIPPHQRHRVKWTDPDSETIWLAVHYRDPPEDRLPDQARKS